MDITGFAAAAYGASAVLYGLMALLQLIRRGGGPRGGYLLAACILSAAWAGLNGWQIAQPVLPSSLLWVAETLQKFGWLFFLLAVLSPDHVREGKASGVLTIARLALLGVVATILLSVDETMGLGKLMAKSGGSFDVKLIGQLLLSVAGIALVEQVLRNAPSERRDAVKYLSIGLGAQFVFDFYLYSDGLMFRRLNDDIWLARGAIHVLTIPILLVAAARNPDWSLPLSLSRRIVLHTTALLGTGIYLLVMALAGYYIKIFGGEWGPVVRTIFFFSAGTILAALFVSRRVRGHLKVLINKHFFKYRYDYRDEWLRLIATLTGSHSKLPLQQRIIASLAEIVDSPGGVLFLVGERGDYRFASHLNRPPIEVVEPQTWTPLTAFLATSRWVIDIDEYHEDRGKYGPLELPRWLEDVDDAWLITPLLHDERLIGFVVLIRPRIPQALDWESLDLLKTAGMQAASYLTLSQTAESLAEARQFEGFNRLSAFVIHDLKNLIAQLSLVVDNARRHKANPAFVDDAIGTIENSVGRMTHLMAQLRSAVAPPPPALVDLGELLAGVVANHQWVEPVPRFENRAGYVEIDADSARLSAVIGHIVQNAQDATAATGSVELRLERTRDHALVVVQDSGSGMDKDFVRDRLFRPFASTKGLTGMGIGAYECREFVNSLGGWIDVTSAPGMGTTFTINLPLANAGVRKASSREELTDSERARKQSAGGRGRSRAAESTAVEL